MTARSLLPALAVAVVLGAAGCGGSGPSATKVIDRAAASLGEIRSGRLHVDLALVPHVRGGEPLGFSLDGPFALGGRGSLPVARIDYTQRRGGRSATVTLGSDGRRGWIEAGGKMYELTAQQAAQLRFATSGLARGALGSLPLRDWVLDPRVADAGGAERVTGKLDAVRALNGLFGLTQGLAAGVPAVGRADAQDVARLVRSSSFELVAGRKDHALRGLRLVARFAAATPKALRARLGPLVGADFRFELAVSHANEPVKVTPPAHALPASALPKIG